MSEGNGGPRPAMTRRLLAFARRRFGDAVSCEPLAGDASDRAFFRIRLATMSPLVAMVHPEPFRLDDLPYFVHGRFLKEIGADVPEIVGSYPGEGILLLQDLGDATLMAHLMTASPDRRHFLYRQAVQILAHLQSEGTRALSPDLPAARTALDRDRLLFELRFFAEHYVTGLLGSPLMPAAAADLDAWLESLAETVAGYDRVLCHRDYHSRNLMVRGDRLYMVDFQDARMGPYTYDLASLLRDSYVRLPEELIEEMLDFFLEVTGRSQPGEARPGSFEEEFERTCLQRNIKAIGTFAYQAVVKGNRGYLPSIPPTLESIRTNLERRGERGILELFEGPLLLS
ncbi:MAG: phosphotransferase [Acidobacteria bacterium]|nr:phosphotransferase [Acidobacteriota bacterium]